LRRAMVATEQVLHMAQATVMLNALMT